MRVLESPHTIDLIGLQLNQSELLTKNIGRLQCVHLHTRIYDKTKTAPTTANKVCWVRRLTKLWRFLAVPRRRNYFIKRGNAVEVILFIYLVQSKRETVTRGAVDAVPPPDYNNVKL